MHSTDCENAFQQGVHGRWRARSPISANGHCTIALPARTSSSAANHAQSVRLKKLRTAPIKRSRPSEHLRFLLTNPVHSPPARASAAQLLRNTRAPPICQPEAAVRPRPLFFSLPPHPNSCLTGVTASDHHPAQGRRIDQKGTLFTLTQARLRARPSILIFDRSPSFTQS